MASAREFDAAIVGAGHNGLVCACYLAAAGLKVGVFERRDVVGGAAVTEEFHPGFRNSAAAYTVSLLNPKVIADLRPLWQAVRGPVLVLHGEHSDLLTADIYREMLARPGTEGIVVPDTGHAPALMDAALVAAVRSFLLA